METLVKACFMRKNRLIVISWDFWGDWGGMFSGLHNFGELGLWLATSLVNPYSLEHGTQLFFDLTLVKFTHTAQARCRVLQLAGLS